MTGAVLGGAAFACGVPLPVCGVAAGLCSVAGMLPDIDSDTSRSFQECIYLAAGLGAMLFFIRLKLYIADANLVLLAGAAVFLFIRFGIGWFIRKVTFHRGMVHSIPAAVLCGEAVFLCANGTTEERTLKGIALFIGYMSHLILDEIFSIDSTGQIFKPFRLKKSFGTALKFTNSKRMTGTLAVYAAAGTLGYAISVQELNDNKVGSGGLEETVASVQTANQHAINPLPANSQLNNYRPPMLPIARPVGDEFDLQRRKVAPAPIFLP